MANLGVKRTLRPVDLAYLRALRTEGEALYRDQDAQIDKMREMRELRFAVDVGTAKVCDVEHRDATIADELQRTSAMFTVNPATCRVRHPKVGKSAEENATQRQYFHEALLDEAGSREAGPTTHERAVDAAVADGGAWTKFLWVKDHWDKRYAMRLNQFASPQAFEDATEEAKKAGVPFDWLSVDAKTVMPFYRGRKLSEVLEIQERPLSPTFRQYRLGLREDEVVPEEMADPDWRGKSVGLTTVTWVEHWTETTVTYAVFTGPGGAHIVDGPRPHRYGRPPYFCALPLVHSHWRNRKVGWSVSEPKRYLVELKSFYRTLLAQTAVFQSRPTMFREVPEGAAPLMGSDGAPLQTQEYQAGTLVNLRPGEKVTMPNYPAVSEALKEEIASVDRDIEKMEPPRINTGGDLGGAGWAISQVQAENKTRYVPISHAVERMLAEISAFAEDLIKRVVKETVYAYRASDKESGWISAGPDTFADPVKIEWTLDPETPSSQVIDERYWAARVTNGSASTDMMTTALGSNPDEVRKGRALDRIRATPWYMSAEDAAVLAEIGRGDLLKMQQQAEGIAQSGIVPPPPAPGISPNPAAPGEPGMVPGAPAEVMPGGGVPDVGALAMAPGGQGAAPVGVPSAGGYGPNTGQQNRIAQAVGQ